VCTTAACAPHSNEWVSSMQQTIKVSQVHPHGWMCLLSILLFSLSLMNTANCCSLTIHGEITRCVGAPDVETTVTNSHMVPSSFSVLEVGGDHACAIRHHSGRVICWSSTGTSASQSGDAYNVPDYIIGARALSLGAQHSCALWGAENRLTCWGSNLGLSSPVDVSSNVRMLAVGHPLSNHVCFLYMSAMDVACVGQNTQGQLGLGPSGSFINNVPAEYIISYM
jgi:hypothetical protein